MGKTIFVDMDGTFTGYVTKHNVSPATRKAVINAVNSGYEIIPCTGRPLEFVKDKIAPQADNIFNYAVVCNGSMVYDLKNNKPIDCTSINGKSLASLCALAESHNLAIALHCLDGIFCNYVNADYPNPIVKPVQNFIKSKAVAGVIIAGYDFDELEALESEILRIPDIQISNRHKAFHDSSHKRTGIAFYDITPANTDKGLGIKILCEKLNIPKSDRIAIGDDYNDLPMFRECGYAVAMGNALPEIKKHSDFVTGTNDNDGVAAFLSSLPYNK